MRDCQICKANGKRVIDNYYHNQKGFCLFECTACGHRYVDGLELSQAWFDEYYLTKYTTDDKPYSDGRLASLAECVAGYKPELVLDIGGMDGELRSRLSNYKDIKVCDVVGVVERTDYVYDAVILSHTLEHIYDIDAMFERIDNVSAHNTLLLIEIPIHLIYQDPQAYDWHWQHINKFRPQDIERLCIAKGFTVMESKQIENYREYQVWRIVGRA